MEIEVPVHCHCPAHTATHKIVSSASAATQYEICLGSVNASSESGVALEVDRIAAREAI